MKKPEARKKPEASIKKQGRFLSYKSPRSSDAKKIFFFDDRFLMKFPHSLPTTLRSSVFLFERRI